MSRGILSWIVLAALGFSSSFPAARADVLDFLPKDSLAFAHAKNLAQADAKLTKFLHLFDSQVQSPLSVLHSVLRIEKGIDDQGDALIAFLMVAGPTELPAPMVVLPLTSYEDFALAVGADKSGEVCRIRLAAEEVLAAKVGQHVLLMNREHRSTMLQLLASNSPSAPRDELEDWLRENDFSIAISQTGLGLLSIPQNWQLLNSLLFDSAQGGYPTPNTSERPQTRPYPVAQLLKVRFKELAVGLAVDPAGNSRLRWAAQLHQRQAPLATAPTANLPLRWEGFAEGSYLTVGTGRLPHGTNRILAELFTMMARQDAPSTGRENFSSSDWSQEKLSWKMAFSGVREAAFYANPPAKDDPLLALCCVRLEVENSSAYLESLTRSFEIANSLEEKSTSDIKLIFESAPLQIAGQQGLVFQSDLNKGTGDENVVFWQEMLTALTGPEHKLSIYCHPLDEHQVFLGLESLERLEKFAKAYQNGETKLVTGRGPQATLGLLDSQATWKQLIDPRGIVEYTQEAMNRLNVFGFMPQLPIYSTAPPWGVSVGGNESLWQGEFVLPAESAQALASFMTEVRRVFGAE